MRASPGCGDGKWAQSLCKLYTAGPFARKAPQHRSRVPAMEDQGNRGKFRVFPPAGKIGLDAKTQMPYSRPLMNASAAADRWRTEALLRKQTNDPRGWARTWESCDDNTPAGHEAFGRLQGRKRHASDTQARSPRGCRWLRGQCRLAPREASNRSRKSIVSSAPLGHNLSGGFFFAIGCLSMPASPGRWPKPGPRAGRYGHRPSGSAAIPNP